MNYRRALRAVWLCALSCSCLASANAATVQILLRPVDLVGDPIASIGVGGQFQIQAIVQDLRDPTSPTPGVFQVYLSASYNDNLISIVASPHPVNAPDPAFTFSSEFSIIQRGDLAVPGAIGGAGAASNVLANNSAPHLVWSLPATAIAPGTLQLTPSFDATDDHDVFVFGENAPVLAADIQFVGGSLTIVPEPSSLVLAGTCLVSMGGALAIRPRRTRRQLA